VLTAVDPVDSGDAFDTVDNLCC